MWLQLLLVKLNHIFGCAFFVMCNHVECHSSVCNQLSFFIFVILSFFILFCNETEVMSSRWILIKLKKYQNTTWAVLVIAVPGPYALGYICWFQCHIDSLLVYLITYILPFFLLLTSFSHARFSNYLFFIFSSSLLRFRRVVIEGDLTVSVYHVFWYFCVCLIDVYVIDFIVVNLASVSA